MKKNFLKVVIIQVFGLFFVLSYAAPTPFMDPPTLDKYSPGAQALGMGGSFANIWADDPQAMWENPAAAALFARGNRIGIGTGNLEWLKPFGSGGVAGGLDLGGKFTLGLGFTTVNWDYAPEEYSPVIFYSGMGAAVSWHSFLDVSVGFTGKMLYEGYPDTSFFSRKGLDIGAIVEWPVLASLNMGDLTLMGRAMHFDITPGIHYTVKNLGPDVTNNYLFGFNVAFTLADPEAGCDLIHIKYARDMKDSETMNALQFGFYDVVFVRFGNHAYGSTEFIASGYGISYSRLIMSLVHALGADPDRTGLINRLQLEQHWGSWSWNGSDIGVTGNTLLLKWSSK